MDKKEIWVYIQETAGDEGCRYAEAGFGRVADVSFELLGKGRELADQMDARLCAVLLTPFAGSSIDSKTGYDHQSVLDSLKGWADRVYYVDEDSLREKLYSVYAPVLSSLAEKYKPEIILYGATVFGRSLAPAVAAKLHAGLTADCTMLDIDPETGLLRQTRPAFGGNLMATIVCPDHRPQMATVRPGVFPKGEKAGGCGTEVVRCDVSSGGQDGGVDILYYVNQADNTSIKDADILLVCGRGIGSKANVNKVAKLAEAISEKYGVSCDYGVTRPLVDLGWAEYRHQVGQTGLSVAPKLLISLGVSGAIQHLAGISGAKTIVAVNTDPEAPIFGTAHYSIVRDCMEIVEEMAGSL